MCFDEKFIKKISGSLCNYRGTEIVLRTQIEIGRLWYRSVSRCLPPKLINITSSTISYQDTSGVVHRHRSSIYPSIDRQFAAAAVDIDDAHSTE